MHSRKGLLPLVLLTAAAGLAIGWSVRTVAAPVQTDAATEPTLIKVTNGEVSSVMSLGMTVRWKLESVGPNGASGVLTSVAAESAVLDQGDTLYSVDLRPVVVARGQVPMFRDIGRGAEGEDVKQLQEFLSSEGYQVRPNGVAGASTDQAIRAWQKSTKVPVDGVVRAGDVVFTSTTPVRVIADPEHHVGDRLAGGESIMQRFSDRPETVLQLSESQAALVPPGLRVSVANPNGGTWTGTSDQGAALEGGGIEVSVVAEDGGPICGADCGAIAAGVETNLLADVFRVEPTSGLQVPITAIEVKDDGTSSVTTSAGKTISVDVLASADGVAVISGSGIKEGTALVVAAR